MPTIHLDLVLQGKEGERISPPRLGPQWPVVLNPQLWTLTRACPCHPTPYPDPLSLVHNHSPIWFDTGFEFRLFWDYSRFSLSLQQHSSTSLQIHNSQIFYSLHLKMWPIGWPETSVRNYHYTLRNNPEEGSSHLLRGGSLKLLLIIWCFFDRASYSSWGWACQGPKYVEDSNVTYMFILKCALKLVEEIILLLISLPLKYA